MQSSTVFIFTCLIGFSAVIVTVQQLIAPAAKILNPCTSSDTCRKCIQQPECSWCYDLAFNETPRCFISNSTSFGQRCSEEFIVNPTNIITFLSLKKLSHAKGKVQPTRPTIHSGYEAYLKKIEEEGIYVNQFQEMYGRRKSKNITQIAPQHLELKLRAKTSYWIEMFYTQAEDYPVDLYYLMDLSRSMYDDKETLSMLGDELASTMRKMTSNFRLGFGSFVDKVVMPYVSTLEVKLHHPCSDCEPPYGFLNHLKLNTNSSKFSERVREAMVSGNLDAPEGGFDAIMQSIVCEKEIGWREEARRLLVYSTDSGFHYAGDGKLGGIVAPNDGKCHLNARGEYYMSTKQDYPSISQINLKAKEHSMNIIFAVTKHVIKTYEELTKLIEASSCAQLTQDSSNIVQIIKEQYEAISSSIEMKHNASEYLNIRFWSSCTDEKSEVVETAKCGGIKIGDIIKYHVEVELLKCPEDPAKWHEVVEIRPLGLDESLRLDVVMQCGCDCENPAHKSYIPKADKCNNKGTLICGRCVCDPGATGLECQCTNASTTEEEEVFIKQCIDPNTNLICNGNGICECGKCICDPFFTGIFCDCDTTACDRRNNKLCSGHGNCTCHGCECEQFWTGEDCSCTTKTDNCIKPPDPTDKGTEKPLICSGHGDCLCGECKCYDISRTGKFCEICPTCGDKCENYKDCVQCIMYHKGKYDNETCTKMCTKIHPNGVDKVIPDKEKNEPLCAYYDDDGCRFAYKYHYNQNNELEIDAQRDLECPLKVFLLGIVLGVIAIVVLVGLAILLMWKLLTTIHDRREFAKFEKERMMAKWDAGENPIYKQATSTFKNPTYAGKG